MSPQSRRSQPPGGSPSGQRRGAAPPPNALFAEMLRAARELLAVRSPLDAELMVSELLGTWWGQHGGGRRAATVEQLVGEGLVDYAGEQRSPAALALLSGIACLGTEVSMLTARTHLPRRGLPWAAPSPGSSFPLPIKRATVRQSVRPGVRIRGQRTPLQTHVAPAGTAPAWRTWSKERNHSGHDNVA